MRMALGTGFCDAGADTFDGLSATRTKIIEFPGSGFYSLMDSYLEENPDPRESCGSNWRSNSGLSIWVSLLKSPSHQMSPQFITSDPLQISWKAPTAQPANPTLGYEVLVGDSSLKKIQDYRTSSTFFPASTVRPGNY